MKIYQVTVTTTFGRAPIGYVVPASEAYMASKAVRETCYADKPCLGTEAVEVSS